MDDQPEEEEKDQSGNGEEEEDCQQGAYASAAARFVRFLLNLFFSEETQHTNE